MSLLWSLFACEGDKIDTDTVVEETEWLEPSAEHEPPPIVIENAWIDCGDDRCHNDEMVTCMIAVTESDLHMSFQWRDSTGVLLGSDATLDLSMHDLAPLEEILCSIEVSDPMNTAREVMSASVIEVLDNRSPTIPILTISWTRSGSQPTSEDDLTCQAEASQDADGQDVSYSVEWYMDGQVHTEALLPMSETQGGDVWTCRGWATDGIESSDSVEESVSIVEDCALANCDWSISIGEVKIDWMYIPSGSDPLGRYTIDSGFYMMSTEVTQRQFETLMGYSAGDGQNMNWGLGDTVPAYFVSWNMAAAYANALTSQYSSLTACYTCTGSGTTVECVESMNPYSCDGFRLPTEAEWEYAARSGTNQEFWTVNGGGVYSESICDSSVTILDGVNNPLLSDYGWFCGNSGGLNQDVATRSPNGFGLYDTIGNVREWTEDWYDYNFIPTGPNPFQSQNTGTRTLRGGNLDATPFGMQLSHRNNRSPDNRYYGYGFRLIRME